MNWTAVKQFKRQKVNLLRVSKKQNHYFSKEQIVAFKSWIAEMPSQMRWAENTRMPCFLWTYGTLFYFFVLNVQEHLFFS